MRTRTVAGLLAYTFGGLTRNLLRWWSLSMLWFFGGAILAALILGVPPSWYTVVGGVLAGLSAGVLAMTFREERGDRR